MDRHERNCSTRRFTFGRPDQILYLDPVKTALHKKNAKVKKLRLNLQIRLNLLSYLNILSRLELRGLETREEGAQIQ